MACGPGWLRSSTPLLLATALLSVLIGCSRSGSQERPRGSRQPTPTPMEVAPEIPGFTFLRRAEHSSGGSTHVVPVYRCEAFARAAGLLPGQTAPDCEFTLLPGGSFQMGTAAGQGRPAEQTPQHTVNVAPFLLARTEVTQRVWSGLTGIGQEGQRDLADPGWPLKGVGELHPIYYVTWQQADDLCRSVQLRLPSEAEWEYACRAGTSTTYSFGDDVARLGEHGWYFRNSGLQELPVTAEWDRVMVLGAWGCQTHPVATRAPNAFGLVDLHGNVWEWCADTWHPGYEGAPPDQTPWVDPGAPVRVLRGGGWNGRGIWCASASRGRRAGSFPGHHVGLRPARSP